MPYSHAPQKLANLVYGGRMGNYLPDDGYTFRDNHGKALPLRPGNTWLELLPSGVPTFSK